jgi:hypothetical protein
MASKSRVYAAKGTNKEIEQHLLDAQRSIEAALSICNKDRRKNPGNLNTAKLARGLGKVMGVLSGISTVPRNQVNLEEADLIAEILRRKSKEPKKKGSRGEA